MTVGLSAANLANPWLDLLRNTTFTAKTVTYVKLHVGDPGSAGASSAAAVTTRSAITFSAASGGAIAVTGTNPSWSMTATETISHISVWDHASAGNFLWSAALSSSKAVTSGDTLTLTTCGLSLSAIAA